MLRSIAIRWAARRYARFDLKYIKVEKKFEIKSLLMNLSIKVPLHLIKVGTIIKKSTKIPRFRSKPENFCRKEIRNRGTINVGLVPTFFIKTDWQLWFSYFCVFFFVLNFKSLEFNCFPAHAWICIYSSFLFGGKTFRSIILINFYFIYVIMVSSSLKRNSIFLHFSSQSYTI